MIFLHISNKQNYPFKWLYFSWYKRVETQEDPDSSCYACSVYHCGNLGFLLDMLPFLLFELFLLFLVIKIIILFFSQRFDEKKKLLTDHDAVLQTISEKLAECQQWQAQHKVQKPLH